MYSVIDISFASLKQQIKYVYDHVFGAKFSLKGFEYAWIVSSRTWKKGDRVLDVGAGYSNLPMYLADTFGCNVWAVDDFGLASGEPFWKRHLEPEEHIRSNPQVNFVRERLGDPETSTLEPGSFDAIFSASALEHVPNSQILPVWKHMDLLLKPGGELIHEVDMQFPVNRGALSIFQAFILDALYPILPEEYKIEFAYFTPINYLRRISRVTGKLFNPSGINTFKMITDPDITIDSPHFFLNRYKENMGHDLKIRRQTTLLIHLRKHA